MNSVNIAGKEIILDDELLKFDEHSINEFLQRFATNYNVYQQAHADSQYLFSKFDDRYEVVFSDKFRLNREHCTSDKAADMLTKLDPEVQEALENQRTAKRNVSMLYSFLRSMDKAFDSAQQIRFME